MEINVDIKSSDIERQVVDAIVKSSIGTAIQKAVAEAEQRLSSGWDNPVRQVIEGEVRRIALDIVREKCAAQIRAFIQEKLTEEIVNQIFEKAWKSFTERNWD